MRTPTRTLPTCNLRRGVWWPKLPQSQRLSDIDATGLLSVVVQELDHTVSVVHVAGEVDMATGPLRPRGAGQAT